MKHGERGIFDRIEKQNLSLDILGEPEQQPEVVPGARIGKIVSHKLPDDLPRSLFLVETRLAGFGEQREIDTCLVVLFKWQIQKQAVVSLELQLNVLCEN